MDMRVATSFVRAVVAKEVKTCGNTMISRNVREIARGTRGARATSKEDFAHGDFVGIVGKFAVWAEGTVT